jgi:prepilin signal peptidase PulO-like enzyme (type II secretory pathway)
MELGVAALFVVSFVVWPEPLSTPLAIWQFGLWLAAGVALSILFAYDLRWQLLPNKVNFIFIGLGAVYAIGNLAQQGFSLSALGSLTGAVATLSGLYLALYLYSRGAWIGFGDIKLGIGLAAFVGTWPLALLALFLANLFGTLVVLPGLISGRLDRKAHIPFGPFLIAATVVVVLYGKAILRWYLGLSFGAI